MVWPGLGVNYKAAQANWAADAAYFQSIGLNNIRPNLFATSLPWASTTQKVWRDCAAFFAGLGFWVTYGYSSPPAPYNSAGGLTATIWAQYHDAIVAEATYIIAQGIPIAEFEMGNELELTVDGTTLTQTQLRTNLRQLATDIKAITGWSASGIKVSYACIVTTLADGRGSMNWASEGIGALDTLSIHPYGTVSTTQGYNYFQLGILGQTGLAEQSIRAIGSDKCYISEFNLDGGASNLLLLNTEQSVTAMRQVYQAIQGFGTKKALIYSYVGFNNGDNQFAMKNTDGSFNPVWDVFLSQNHRQGSIPG